VTLHNVRNCAYRTETDYTPQWETRVIYLSRLRGIDLAITYWGSKWMAHPIVSFQFDNAPPICFSIETRLEVGEEFSSIGGLYRRYELIYVCADERDVIRVRSNFATAKTFIFIGPRPRRRERDNVFSNISRRLIRCTSMRAGTTRSRQIARRASEHSTPRPSARHGIGAFSLMVSSTKCSTNMERSQEDCRSRN
jgi:hypothetical protein